MKFLVFLGQSSHSDPFHHGIGVLESVTQSAGRWINDDLVAGHTQVSKKDIELFRQVHINGRGRDNDLAIGQSTGADTFMIALLHRRHGKIFALAEFPDLLEDFFILLVVGRSPGHDRNIHGVHHLFNHRGGFVGPSIQAVGVRAFELDHDEVGPVLVNALLGPRFG